MLVAKWQLVFSELTAENKGVKNPLVEFTGAGHFPEGLLRTTSSAELRVAPSTTLAQLVERVEAVSLWSQGRKPGNAGRI